MEELKKQIRTGDLILFDSKNTGIFRLFDTAIKFFTGSDYNHIAMVLVNPTFMAKTSNLPIENFTGYFVWESSWEGTPDPQDGKVKLGVQLTPLEEVINNNRGKFFISSSWDIMAIHKSFCESFASFQCGSLFFRPYNADFHQSWVF